MIDQKHGAVIVKYRLILDHDHVQIVQQEPLSVETRRYNGMVLVPDFPPQDDDAKVIWRNSGFLESNKFRYRVIFAVSSFSGECGKWRAPDILCAVLRQVAPRLDFQVNGAIDLTKAGPTLQHSCAGNDCKKLKRGARLTGCSIFLAIFYNFPFIFDFARYVKPLLEQGAGSDWGSGESEWLDR